MLGIEGGHRLGGSIASIRQAYDLGVRYITQHIIATMHGPRQRQR